MTTYNHLTQEERHHIEIQRKQNISLGKIAAEMNRSKSTISREIRRNTGQRGYRYQQANRLAQQRHADKPKFKKMTEELTAYVDKRLQGHWSPGQIGGRLKREGKAGVGHLCPVGTKRFTGTSMRIRRLAAACTTICGIA